MRQDFRQPIAMPLGDNQNARPEFCDFYCFDRGLHYKPSAALAASIKAFVFVTNAAAFGRFVAIPSSTKSALRMPTARLSGAAVVAALRSSVADSAICFVFASISSE